MVSVIEKNKCPSCGELIDANTNIDGNKEVTPGPGDLSLCIYCATMLEYEDNLTLKVLQREKLNRIRRDTPGIYKLLKNAQQAIILHQDEQ